MALLFPPGGSQNDQPLNTSDRNVTTDITMNGQTEGTYVLK